MSTILRPVLISEISVPSKRLYIYTCFPWFVRFFLYISLIFLFYHNLSTKHIIKYHNQATDPQLQYFVDVW